MGFIYRIVNKDFKLEIQKIEEELDNFEYGKFISNYTNDDIDEKIEKLIYELVQHITDEFVTESQKGAVTSISNFLKTDKNYIQTILYKYISELKKRDNLKGLIDYFGDIFRR